MYYYICYKYFIKYLRRLAERVEGREYGYFHIGEIGLTNNLQSSLMFLHAVFAAQQFVKTESTKVIQSTTNICPTRKIWFGTVQNRKFVYKVAKCCASINGAIEAAASANVAAPFEQRMCGARVAVGK
eukprot:GHVR01019355.1.p1 GENE.GHVR01019355.1~~GHVR01019355.1.p1  ORF type:complete len:128 (+),score=11.40 GHVR01019355.1:143-526(+)